MVSRRVETVLSGLFAGIGPQVVTVSLSRKSSMVSVVPRVGSFSAHPVNSGSRVWCAKLARADRERASASLEARMVSPLRSRPSRECHLTTLAPDPVRHDHLPERMNTRFHLDFRGCICAFIFRTHSGIVACACLVR